MTTTLNQLGEIAALIHRANGQLTALHQNPVTDGEKIEEQLNSEIGELMTRGNELLQTMGLKMVPLADRGNVDTFLFHRFNPLNMVPVSQIRGCDIIGDTIHFHIINSEGKPEGRKTRKSPYILDQIERYNILIETNR